MPIVNARWVPASHHAYTHPRPGDVIDDSDIAKPEPEPEPAKPAKKAPAKKAPAKTAKKTG